VKSTIYLTLEEALELHHRLIERFGGAPGVRDLGLLESALARPRSGYYAGLAQQAAALLQSLVMNHAFVDGNKRIAIALASVFLEVNGQLLQVDTQEGETFMIDTVIKGRAELEAIATWLAAHLTPVPGRPASTRPKRRR
jgi:death-on-curing protein